MTSHFLFFDLETTGLFGAKKKEIDFRKQEQFPHIVQLSWQLVDYANGEFTTKENIDYVIRPDGYTIPAESSAIHGISEQVAKEKGVPIREALLKWVEHYGLYPNTYLVCHNIEFDVTLLFYHLYRVLPGQKIDTVPCICTMLDSVALCKLPSMSKFKNPKDPYKYPKLSELYRLLFGYPPSGTLHNSQYDVECTIECFKELKKRGLLTVRNATLLIE